MTDSEGAATSGSENDHDLLRRLRQTPQIFSDIEACTELEIRNQRRLRSDYDDQLVRAALAVHDCRRRASGLLPGAERLWLTRVGLEQCTAWPVARHKAERFHQYSQDTDRPIYDLCSGIGVDAAALADNSPLTAIDADPAMCLRTKWNSEIWGTRFPVQTICDDVTRQDWTGRLVHADPDRRGERDRPVKRLEQYQPDLTWMQQLIQVAEGGALKLGPASNFMQKFPGCEIELISLDGECREATVWFGSMADQHSFRATVLPSGESVAADPLSAWADQVSECGAWIFDPDPAVVRSGLLDVVAEQLQLSRLDSEEEYLTGPRPVDSGFVRAFQIETVLPNNLRELKNWLRRDPSRHYEVKCRRIPTNASVLQRQLPTGDAPARVVFFIRIQSKARIVVARRIDTDAA